MGDSFSSLLNLSGREQSTVNLLLQQVFDDVLPEEVNLDQLPRVFKVGQSSLRLDYSVIRSAQPLIIENLMVSISDITSQIQAQMESRKWEQLLNRLRNKNRSVEFLRDLKLSIEKAKDYLSQAQGTPVRFILHTLKGNSSLFGLTSLAELIHHIEDKSEINLKDIEKIEAQMKSDLEENFDLLEVTLDSIHQREYKITERDLMDLKRGLLQESAASAVTSLELWIESVQRERWGSLLQNTQKSVLLLAEKSGKKLEFVVLNPNTLVNGLLLGGLIQNLVHIYRNCVDHGVQMPEERGTKPELAKIITRLHESEQGWHLEIEDDGRGISTDKLVEKALSKGILSEDEARGLSESDKLKLIFREGLSTAEVVSEISGRGVGMSAIAQIMQDLKGSLHVESRPKEGTKFQFYIPK